MSNASYAPVPRLRFLGAICVFVGSLLVGCGGSEATGPEGTPGPMAAFAGSWDAISDVHTALIDATLIIDVVANGASLVLVITETGGYTATLSGAGQSAVETGAIRQVGSRLILTPSDPNLPEQTVDYVLLGDTMTWDGEGVYDFAMDGIPEVTSERIVFQKR